MAVPQEVRRVHSPDDIPTTLTTDREPLPFPTQFQPLEMSLAPTLSPRVAVNRAFFPHIVQIRRERREVLRWERTVNLEGGRVRRQDEVLDSLDRLESTLLGLRAQILSTLNA